MQCSKTITYKLQTTFPLLWSSPRESNGEKGRGGEKKSRTREKKNPSKGEEEVRRLSSGSRSTTFILLRDISKQIGKMLSKQGVGNEGEITWKREAKGKNVWNLKIPIKAEKAKAFIPYLNLPQEGQLTGAEKKESI